MMDNRLEAVSAKIAEDKVTVEDTISYFAFTHMLRSLTALTDSCTDFGVAPTTEIRFSTDTIGAERIEMM